MPEGDTIWRAARTLDRALAGSRVAGFRSPLPAVARAAERLGLVGQTLVGVEASGKHLLVRFSGGALLHTHLRLSGSWHLYRRGSPWRRPEAGARVVIETDAAVAVCFLAPVVELVAPRAERRHPALQRLGPDLLAPGFDARVAVGRLRARGELEIGTALLDQTALAGIGNVYKSEVLHLCGVDPFRRVAELGEAVLERLVTEAGRQLRRNLGPGLRRTTAPHARERLWVYGRGGRACRRCGATIRRRLQGPQARATYWCPGCQPGPAG